MQADLTRPIIGIENRTAQEVFDIMCDRIRSRPSASIPAEIGELVRDLKAELSEQQNYGEPIDRSVIERAISALTHPAPTHEDGSGEAVCDVITIGHSSGFPDHFTRIRVGDRSLTMFMSKIKGRCEYHAAELNWLLNGAKKPDIMDFNDTEPDGLAEYLSHTSGEVTEADDSQLLDALRSESWDLRCFPVPTGGDDADIGWRVIGHWMAEPHERVVAEVYHDDPRAAIRAALRGDAS